MDTRALIIEALAARGQAYCPYSGFAVGAALLGQSGRVYTGCNVENASYPATNCAERTALFHAVSKGERRFTALALAAGKAGEAPIVVSPCGICLQALSEFDDGDLKLILARDPDDFYEYSLKEMLPHRFGSEQLK